MAYPVHDGPIYHIPSMHRPMSERFPTGDAGLPIPDRRTSDTPSPTAIHLATGRRQTVAFARFRLELMSPTPGPVEGLASGAFPRGDFPDDRSVALRQNTLGAPRMPKIEVQCRVAGFDPAETALRWQLVVLQRTCRHRNTGGYRYEPSEQSYQAEWQGRAFRSSFTLFEEEGAGARASANPDGEPLSSRDGSVRYDYNLLKSVVAGGQAILRVAAKPRPWLTLSDYAILRISGHANPTRGQVLDYLGSVLGDRPRPIFSMLKGIFGTESQFRQFGANAQTSERVNFNGLGAHPVIPACYPTFTHPADPKGFPLVTFDFGVGLGQYTLTAGQRPDLLDQWSWQQNLLRSVGLFLGEKLRRASRDGGWLAWAKRAWSAYNGTGAQAQAYAEGLANGPEGSEIREYAAAHPPLATHTNEEVEAWLALPSRVSVPKDPPTWPSFGEEAKGDVVYV